MALKLATRFPIFAPPLDPNSNPSTEFRFSLSTNAAANNAGQTSRATSPPGKRPYRNPPKPTVDPESHPAFRFSNIPKSKPRPVSTAPENIKISDDGLSYVVDGAPFEFKYSYTETPKAKPLKMREAPYVPFGPVTMPRPWTGRAPIPPSKKKLKEFDSFVLPPPHKKGVKPVQSPGPFLPGSTPRYVMSREEILGEPLTKEEVNDLVKSSMKSDRLLHMGRDGFTHNMLDNIHAHWKRRRVCKIKCIGVCTVDMDNVCQQLEEKTGGKVIRRMGGILYLFRGRNYNYKTRPRFPLMLWKPIPPVYPKLILRAPEGLTQEQAFEMRQKGRTLTPICKLGKNGVYLNLATNVREAFEECELVRINCQGLNKSDYRRIGAKLRDLVPCTLISFENEHVLMWRGPNWKSSLADLGDGGEEANNKFDSDSKIFKTLPSESPEFSAPCLPKNPAEHVSNLSHDTSISATSNDLSLDKVEVPYTTEKSKQSVSVTIDVSLTKTYEAETTNDASGLYGEPEPCSSTSPSMTTSHYDSHAERPSKAISHTRGTEDVTDSKSSSDGLSASISGSDGMLASSVNGIDGMVDPHADSVLDNSGTSDVGRPSRSNAPCMKEITLLLEQAVEKGSALVLDKDFLDADNIYQSTVSLAKSAPPEPVFMKHGKAVVQRSEKRHSSTLETKVTTTVVAQNSYMQKGSWEKNSNIPKIDMQKGRREKSPKIPRKDNFDEQLLNIVPQGTLGVDELAKLLT